MSEAEELVTTSSLSRFRRRVQGERKSAWAFFRDIPRVFPYLRPYWKLAVMFVTMIFVGTLMGLLGPWPLALLIDCVLSGKPLPALLQPVFGGLSQYALLAAVVILGLVVKGLDHGLGVVNEYVSTKLEQRMALDMRSDMFRQAQRLSLTFHDQNATGMLMYKINNQADAVGSITIAIPQLVEAVLTVVGMFVIAYLIDHELALLSLTVVPLIYITAGYYAKYIEPQLYRVQGMEGQSLSIVYEAMSMLRVIVAFGREGHEHGRFYEQATQAVDARVKLTVRQTMFALTVTMITALGTAIVLFVGAVHVIQGDLTVGGLIIIMSYIASIYSPLEQISHTLSGLQQHFIGFRMALGLLDTEPEIKEAPDAIAIDRVAGRVAFEDVTFSYQAREPALKNISFDVQPGQRIAVVGQTGAGKTTMVSLMMRFYDPAEGTVSLDGTDIRQLTLPSLRDQISIVLQDPLLFSGSILENIRYGRLEATDDEVFEAAKAANAHDFISRLPLQYETQLGEGGAQISGGERQRICVARAFLRDSPILILDEPTSSIDSKTESVILDALDKLMENRTTFMIAHRLSTIRHSDRILVIDHGELVEQGTHEELLEHDGLYKQLHEAQIRQRRRPGAALTAISADADFAEPEIAPPGAEPETVGSEQGVAEQAPIMPVPTDPRPVALLLIAAGAALNGGSSEPLRALAALRWDPDAQTREAARLAGALLLDLSALESSTGRQSMSGEGHVNGVSIDLPRSPWTNISAAMSPEEAEALSVLFADSPAWARFVSSPDASRSDDGPELTLVDGPAMGRTA